MKWHFRHYLRFKMPADGGGKIGLLYQLLQLPHAQPTPMGPAHKWRGQVGSVVLERNAQNICEMATLYATQDHATPPPLSF